MNCGGYKTSEVAKNTYLLYGFAEECSIYLLVGKTKALLVDTGMGTGDLNAAIRSITDLPVMVVNTHGHVDHAAGNDQFPVVYMAPGAAADVDEINDDMKEKLPCDPAKSDVKRGPFEKKFLADGEIIDLGGRDVEVLYTPGHTPGCISLLDHGARLLFSGDALGTKKHCTHMLAYVEWGPFSTVSIETLFASLRKIGLRRDEFDGILSGHDDHVLGHSILDQIAGMCKGILDGTAKAFHPQLSPQYGNITCWRVEEEDTAIIYHDETVWNKPPVRMDSFNPHTVEKLTDSIYAFSGIPSECRIYLVVGSEKGLLVDTGLGLADIKSEAEAILNGKPYYVVNTHGHGDHSGGDYQFKEIYLGEGSIGDARMAVKLNSTVISERLAQQLAKNAGDASPEYIPVKTGFKFDLGNKVLEVLEIPGHTPGCIALLDPADKVAFTGDCVLRFMDVLLFLPTSQPIAVYLESMKKLREKVAGFDGIFTGHDTQLIPLTDIDEAVNGVQGAVDGTAPGEDTVMAPGWPERNIKKIWGRHLTIDYK